MKKKKNDLKTNLNKKFDLHRRSLSLKKKRGWWLEKWRRRRRENKIKNG